MGIILVSGQLYLRTLLFNSRGCPLTRELIVVDSDTMNADVTRLVNLVVAVHSITYTCTVVSESEHSILLT